MPSVNNEPEQREPMVPATPTPSHTNGLVAKISAKIVAIVKAVLVFLWRTLTATMSAFGKIPPLPWLGAKLAIFTAPITSTVARYAQVWRSAREQERTNAPSSSAQGQALEFLPAVLEIQESPPSPLGRAVMFLVIAVFTLAIVWASLGKIDIVATAQGKIIPNDYSKVVQPLEAGVIKAIHVRNGQLVKAGDILIELDTTASGADQQRAGNEHRAARVEAARLRALIAGRAQLSAPKDADPRYVALQQQLLQDQFAEQRARLESAQLVIDQRQAALEGTKINIQRLEATVPMLNKRAEAFRKLADEQYVAQTQYLEIESQRVDKEMELSSQRHRLVQDTAALAEAKKNYQTITAEFTRARRDELSVLETKAASLSQEVVKADQRTALLQLTAPISGVVQQLEVHTLGGVVTPAQALLVIAPKEHELAVEAWVENKDIGFVNPQQVAEIKVEAFPFTRYGTITGRIMNLSNDAVPLEKTGLFYAAHVILDRSLIQVEGKEVMLTPGMNVTVEIKTGKRRLIEYFLSPLLRYTQESVRER